MDARTETTTTVSYRETRTSGNIKEWKRLLFFHLSFETQDFGGQRETRNRTLMTRLEDHHLVQEINRFNRLTAG